MYSKIINNQAEDGAKYDAIFMKKDYYDKLIEQLDVQDDDTTEGIDFEYKGKLMGVDIVVYDDETIEQQLMEYSYSFAISSDREPKMLKVI